MINNNNSRVLLTEEKYFELKDHYGGDLSQIKITLSIEELKNVVKFICSLKTENNDIDEDLVFKTSLEEVETTAENKRLERIKNEIIPLDTLRYRLEIQALRKTKGNIELASKELGISERTLYRDIQVFSIDL